MISIPQDAFSHTLDPLPTLPAFGPDSNAPVLERYDPNPHCLGVVEFDDRRLVVLNMPAIVRICVLGEDPRLVSTERA